MNIKIRKIREDALVPIRASDGAVGYDVFASRVLDKKTKEVSGDLPAEIPAGSSALIGIGIQMAVPWPYQAEVRPRSGLASKFDIELSNSPGTIDPDFRGEAGILLRNRGEKPFTVTSGMRVAQLVFSKAEIPILEEIEQLPITRRGGGGFGSTGLTGIGLGTKEYDEIVKALDEYYMDIALKTASRSRCVRGMKRINNQYPRDGKNRLIGQTRKFGCLIVKDDTIIAQGFNDYRPGSPRCEEVGCLRDELNIPSGTQLEKCRAIHAEEWAITNAARIGHATKDATLYNNAEPCEVCATLITNAGIETVVIPKGVYPTNGTQFLRDAGINIRYVKL
jgi:deoxyuridine 5'-triphosphate nucleotidohydrolase